MLVQIGKSQNELLTGDPAMIYLPPVEQYHFRYVFTTLRYAGRTSGEHYRSSLFVAVPSAGTTGLLFDGYPLRVPQWKQLGGGYSGALVAVAEGVHRLRHENPTVRFGAVLYGRADRESYAFPVGMRLAPINAPCTPTSADKINDGLDNDCDGEIDEEICADGVDDDGDGRVDEDCVSLSNTAAQTTTVAATTTTTTNRPVTCPVVIGQKGDAGPIGLTGIQGRLFPHFSTYINIHLPSTHTQVLLVPMVFEAPSGRKVTAD